MAKQQYSSDPNAIYQQLAALPIGGGTALDQPYNAALKRYQKASDSTFMLPQELKKYLGGVSPQYTQDKAGLLAQFSDPKSALFISNPFTRMQAAAQAGQAQKQTYGEILQNVQGLVGMGVNQQQRNVEGLGSQLQAAQKMQSDQRAALQQQLTNSIALQRLAVSRAAANRPRTAALPSQQRTNVYRPIGKNADGSTMYQQVGYSLFNPKSTQTSYTDLNGQHLSLTPQDRVSAISSGFSQQQDVTTDYSDISPFGEYP